MARGTPKSWGAGARVGARLWTRPGYHSSQVMGNMAGRQSSENGFAGGGRGEYLTTLVPRCKRPEKSNVLGT